MDLYERFFEPPAEFRQAPFWFWNHDLDVETLGWQIEQMHEKGLGGFVMHARHGLITPYLSDAWFECVRFCCKKARDLGLIAWAYDERDWPSGPAGGQVIAERANRLSYLRLHEEKIEGPAEITLSDDVIAAYCSADDGPLERIQTPALALGEGSHRLLRAVRFECPPILWFESYLDTLDPQACQAFLRSTYDLHEAKLGNLRELGLAGFFTDEPALSTYPDDLRRIPWTPMLPDAFRQLKGYDLLERLPDLFAPGDAGAQVRYDYWAVATTLFERSYFETIESWCDKRGLELIGHPLGEEPLFFQFRCIGDIFRLLKHMHRPGMDHISGNIGADSPLAIVPKLVASAALLAGRERVGTETFGESGWGLSLRQMKWVADWQMVQGVNYIIPHAFYYSIAERRKKDSPPSEFYQAPFWPHYRLFADYTARVTAAMTGGEHVAKIAVLYPMASVWADFVPGDEVGDEVMGVEHGFTPVCRALLEIHRDYVIVDDQSFSGATTDDNSFAVNGLYFEALVLPPMTTVRAETLAALKTVAQAVPVIAVGNTKLRVLDADPHTAPNLVDLVDELPGLRALAAPSHENLEEALSSIPPDVRIDEAPQVYCLHRRKDGLDLFFFANTSTDAVATTASLDVTGAAQIWDPMTGDATPAPGQHMADGRIELPLCLAPMGSHLVAVDPSRHMPVAPDIEFTPETRLKICEVWEFTPENGNFLPLRCWDMTTRTRHKATELRYATSFVAIEPIANLRAILDGIPAHPVNVPEAVRPMMASETQAIVLLDGKPLCEELPWEIDAKFRVLGLGGRCEAGTHRIEVVVKNHGWFPQPGLQEYAWLAGDFQIDSEGEAPCLTPVRGLRSGPWERQGFPYFSGTGTYCVQFNAPDEIFDRALIRLDMGRVGDLVHVEVNGQDLGVRPWPPYCVHIGDVLRPGENTLALSVTNTNRNLIEGPDVNTCSGLLDDVCIEIGSA
ncbi:MAG TPA: hypothetical protein ENN80_09020 [Candidatus Hydrogenedentes bacterium]|nr:hypothetical protein [Candidatus Hydrogenedentota bacterium]